MRTFLAVLGCAAILASDGRLLAAQSRRASPHETTSATIDGAHITITYGRPYMRGRTIMGGLVPYGPRLGDRRRRGDDARDDQGDPHRRADGRRGPLHALDAPVGRHVEADRQSARRASGTPSTTRGRISPASISTTRVLDKPVEQLTIAIEKGTHGGGVLAIAWETTEVSVPFTVLR